MMTKVSFVWLLWCGAILISLSSLHEYSMRAKAKSKWIIVEQNKHLATKEAKRWMFKYAMPSKGEKRFSLRPASSSSESNNRSFQRRAEKQFSSFFFPCRVWWWRWVEKGRRSRRKKNIQHFSADMRPLPLQKWLFYVWFSSTQFFFASSLLLFSFLTDEPDYTNTHTHKSAENDLRVAPHDGVGIEENYNWMHFSFFFHSIREKELEQGGERCSFSQEDFDDELKNSARIFCSNFPFGDVKRSWPLECFMWTHRVASFFPITAQFFFMTRET